jgi:hypothetical protein
MTRRLAAVMCMVALGGQGCAALLLGAGAAGGYAISRDSVKNHFDLSRDFVYRESLKVAGQKGLVKLDDARHGVIQATISDAHVTITVKPLTKETVELKVKARRMLLPKIDVAQDVYNAILERLD